LSDLFPDRRAGTETLIERVTQEFGDRAHFWMGLKGFGSGLEAKANAADVASTNFLATAALVATQLRDALIIDFGSTTADLIPVKGGKVVPQGVVDADRLASGELVYSGLTRTAVMAVATTGVFKGRQQGLAREYLATMADVRRILGDLPDGVDLHATADGRGKSVEESLARLARMFCRDAAEGSVEDWRQSASVIAEAQMRSLRDAAHEVIGRAALPADAPVVTAGIGAAQAASLARTLGRTSLSFGDLVKATDDCRIAATYSAPAVAVALLAASDGRF
jgi:Predicted transcriptional regulator/sugar kinase